MTCRRPLLRLARLALVRQQQQQHHQQQQQQQQRARMMFSPRASSHTAAGGNRNNSNKNNNNDNDDSSSRRTAADGGSTTDIHRGRGPDDDDDVNDAGEYEDGNSRRTSSQQEATTIAKNQNDHHDHDAEEDDSTVRLIEGIPVEEIHSPRSRQQVNDQYAHLLVDDRSLFRHVIEIAMPDLGDDVGPATLLQWHKQVGDIVEHGALLCEIETAQFTFTMEMDDDELGLLDEIYVPAGTGGILTGQRLAKILHPDDERTKNLGD
jgi:Biotin-requiring enzyme